MVREWRTPDIEYSNLYADFLNQIHFLIAGATGAGKSTVVNGMIHAALRFTPDEVGFILIDPKGTELDEYKNLPHTIMYADSRNGMNDCVKALNHAMNLVKIRMADMKRRKIREYDGSDIYVIIDELMILMTRAKREVMTVMQDILSLARCAHVHLVACTQSPIAKVIPTELKCNFDSRLALRTVSAQDSRNIIGVKGCECFPNPPIDHIAWGMYRHGASMEVYELPKISDTVRREVIRHWMTTKPRIKLFAR